jgi:hypothetical protein
MARIRSIHPGFLSDEVSMELTIEAPLALLLVQGLWMEADDWGTFEWKPLTLKARVLPAIGADAMARMLDILQREDVDMIRRFEIGGKLYGVVRNFVRYQRPKKPKRFHPVTAESMAYAGFLPDGSRPRSELGGPSGEGGSELTEVEAGEGSEQSQDKPTPVRNRFGTSSEFSPQMEDGGKDGGEVSTHPSKIAGSRKRRAKPKIPIPREAELGEADMAHAQGAGMLPQTAEHEWGQFRAHHLARGSQFSDWHQAWRTWVGNWVSFGRRQIGAALTSASGPKRILAIAHFEERAATYDKSADEPYVPNANRA